MRLCFSLKKCGRQGSLAAWLPCDSCCGVAHHAGPDNADFQSTNLGTNRDFVFIPPLDAEDFDKGE